MLIDFFSGIFKGKNTRLIGSIGLIALATIAGTVNPEDLDAVNYQTGYTLAPLGVPSAFEQGYTWLGIQFYHLGFDYAGFRMIFTLVATLILIIAVNRLTSNVALVTFLFSVMLFFNLTNQIRNWMMISLVLLGISFLIKKKISDYIIYIVLVLLSAQIHTSGYFFLLILPFVIASNKWRKLLVIVASAFTVLIGGTILLLGNGVFSQILASLFSFVSRGNLVERLTNGYGRGTRIFVEIFVVILSFTAAGLSILLANRFEKNKEKDSKVQQKIDVLSMSSITSLFSVPLIFLAPDYSRFPRDATLFLIVLVAIYFENKGNYKNTQSIMALFLLVFVPLFTYVNISIWGSAFINSIPSSSHWFSLW